MQKTSPSVRCNAAPTQLNPSIVLSEESEIQSPRFPVFLVVILLFFVLRLFWKTYETLFRLKRPFLLIHLVCLVLYHIPLTCTVILSRKHRPCSFPPERWSPARSRLLKSVWPENPPAKNPRKKIIRDFEWSLVLLHLFHFLWLESLQLSDHSFSSVIPFVSSPRGRIWGHKRPPLVLCWRVPFD